MAAATAIVLSAVAVGTVSAGRPTLVGFSNNEVRFAMTRAVDGAAARLASGRCREVLGDFEDTQGRALRDVLVAQRRSVDAAFASLRFFDDRDGRTCATSTILAFTQPGSRVIHVCGRRLAQQYVAEPSYVELIVIHEFLHALGAGENPPTSDAITARVKARCAP